MTNPIPSAGETTIIGLPAINVLPITTTGDRPLTQEALDTITRLSEGTALLISARGAVSGSRYLLDEDEITVGRDPRADILPPYPVSMPCSAGSTVSSLWLTQEV